MVTRTVVVEDPSIPDEPPRKSPKKGPAKRSDVTALDRFMQDFETSMPGVAQHGAVLPYGVPVVPTGSLTLDYRMGCGGFPMGRVAEMWGMPGSCKTTQTLLAMAQAQRTFPDKYVAFIDVEGTFDRRWAELHGVDMDRLKLFNKMLYAEQVSDAAFKVASSDLFSMCVLDSIGAMIPREEFEKMADQPTVGTKAKIVTRMVKKLAPIVQVTGMAMVFINQVRAIVGPQGGTTTDGGFGLKHVSSVQIKNSDTGTNRTISVEGKQVIVGKEINSKTVKNKLAPPTQNARMTFIQMATDKHGAVGLDMVAEALDIGKLTGVIERAGSWLTLPCGERFGSADKAVEFLTNTPEEVYNIRTRALETVADTVITNDLPDPADFDEDRAVLETFRQGPPESAPVELDGATG